MTRAIEHRMRRGTTGFMRTVASLLVGTGGVEAINLSHFIGAVHGMERMMGRADTPVRRVLNYASEHYAKDLPIVYVHTVVGREFQHQPKAAWTGPFNLVQVNLSLDWL